MTARRVAPLLAIAAEAFAVVAVLFVVLGGWHRDFHVPLAFSYDALEYLMQVKGTLDNGWWWVHPRLSAPGVFAEILYPSNSNVDQAVVWMMRLVSHDAALVINLSWMILVAASALIASRCLSVLGVSRPTAAVAGLLFALSPYTLARHIDHFSLVTYLVPIPCTAALVIADGAWPRLSRRIRLGLGVGCALLGFNYPYYAFFACFVLLMAALARGVSARDPRSVLTGLALVSAITLTTAINLAPSLYLWSRDGKPIAMPVKQAAEGEQYGLKIRQLVSPSVDHLFPPFRRWLVAEARANFPLENENRNSRLGLVATVGFFVLLAIVFVPALAGQDGMASHIVNASRLTVAALLLAVVGGFGSLFNLLITPEIRAYNRITPLIAFFSLVPVAVVIDRLMRQPHRRLVAVISLAAVAIVGILDQTSAAFSLNREHDSIRAEWSALVDFVGGLERRLPEGAMVFELPVVTFQSDPGLERMLPNDQLKPYIVSRSLHWSFPALANPIVRWQLAVGRLPAPMMIEALVRQGFAAVLIDRDGYADGGQSLVTGFGGAERPDALIARSDRYVAIDLGRVRHADVAADRLPRLGATGPATANLPVCAGSTSANIDAIDRMPSGELSIDGWAIDEPRHALAADVDVVVGEAVLPAFYGTDRPDVERYIGEPGMRGSGFTVRTPPAGGARRVTLRILSADRSCYYQGPEKPLAQSSENAPGPRRAARPQMP